MKKLITFCLSVFCISFAHSRNAQIIPIPTYGMQYYPKNDTGGGGGGVGSGFYFDASGNNAISTFTIPYVQGIYNTSFATIPVFASTPQVSGSFTFLSTTTFNKLFYNSSTTILSDGSSLNPSLRFADGTGLYNVGSGVFGFKTGMGGQFVLVGPQYIVPLQPNTADLGLTSFEWRDLYLKGQIRLINAQAGGVPKSQQIIGYTGSDQPNGSFSFIEFDNWRNDPTILNSNGYFANLYGQRTHGFHVNQSTSASGSIGGLYGVHSDSSTGVWFNVDGASSPAMQIYGSTNSTADLVQIRMNESPTLGVNGYNWLGRAMIFTNGATTVAYITPTGMLFSSSGFSSTGVSTLTFFQTSTMTALSSGTFNTLTASSFTISGGTFVAGVTSMVFPSSAPPINTDLVFHLKNGMAYFGGDNAGSVSGHTIQNSGSNLPSEPNLNFTGTGVTAADDPGNSATKITITAGGGGSDNLGSHVATNTVQINGYSIQGTTQIIIGATSGYALLSVSTPTPLQAMVSISTWGGHALMEIRPSSTTIGNKVLICPTGDESALGNLVSDIGSPALTIMQSIPKLTIYNTNSNASQGGTIELGQRAGIYRNSTINHNITDGLSIVGEDAAGGNSKGVIIAYSSVVNGGIRISSNSRVMLGAWKWQTGTGNNANPDQDYVRVYGGFSSSGVTRLATDVGNVSVGAVSGDVSTSAALLGVYYNSNINLSTYVFTASTSTKEGQYALSVASYGYVSMTSSASIHTLSGCGTSPAIYGGGNAFTILPGATAGGCTITFVPPFKKTPIPIVSQRSTSLSNSLSYTITNSALTLTQTGIGIIDVHLLGTEP